MGQEDILGKGALQCTLDQVVLLLDGDRYGGEMAH